MANFDMIPPDANELFGFNGPPNTKPGMVNWKVVSIVVVVFAVGILIGKEIRKQKDL